MKRDVNALARGKFDLVIIGGGINGIACARDAALRGLRTAVIECADFGGQTSSNSAKIAHCGMRYLQHLDIKRMRESIRERTAFHQLAPHLVESQPFLMPLYGHGLKGKETLSIYLKLYDWLSPERKRFEDEYRHVPDSGILSKEKVTELVPGIDPEKLTGGAYWFEGQMQNTERLSLSLLKSAAENGAHLANYTQVLRISNQGNKIDGVTVKDLFTDEEFFVSSRYVLNAAGPWANRIFDLCELDFKDHGIYASKAFSLLTRPVIGNYALTFPIRPMYEDKKAVVNKKSSLQFAIPWRSKTMFASLHLPCDEDPENVTITDSEIHTYIERINEGFPGRNLERKDVHHVLWGIIPAEEKGSAAPLKQYKIIDHEKEEGISGIGTVVGVKYTTSRDVAEKTIDMVVKQLGEVTSLKQCQTKKTSVWGGDIAFYNQFVGEIFTTYSGRLPEKILKNLIKTYGTKMHEIMHLIDSNPTLAEPLPNSMVIGAQVIYAIRHEIAHMLSDVVLRRTDLGSHQYPGTDSLKACASLMADELGWDQNRIQTEIEAVKNAYIVLPTAEDA